MGRIGVLHGDRLSFNIPWYKKLWIRGDTPSMFSCNNGYCLSESEDFRSPTSVGSYPQIWGGSFCSSFGRVKSLGPSCNAATNLDKFLIGIRSHMPWEEQLNFACNLQSKCLPNKLVELFASSRKECVIDRGPTWRGISSNTGACWGVPSIPMIYFCPMVLTFCGHLFRAERVVPVSNGHK